MVISSLVINLSSALPFNANSEIVSLYFQICVSSHMCFVIVYSILGYWNYPLKNIFGVTGCHIANLLGETGALQIQLHSFIMATTRYIFLFHDNLLLKFSLTTNVSAIICIVRGKVLSFLEACFDLISSSSLSMKIQIMGGKITENLRFKSLLWMLRFFALFSFHFQILYTTVDIFYFNHFSIPCWIN